MFSKEYPKAGIAKYWRFQTLGLKYILSFLQRFRHKELSEWFYSIQLLDTKLAAFQGSDEDKLTLGKYYLYGDSIPKSYHRSLFWLNQVRDKLYCAEAAYLAAVVFESPDSPYYDMGQCLRRYEEAGAGGNPAAQYRLYEIYSAGRYVICDKERAMYWCRLAAGNKHPGAVGILAKHK
jgi:TPR repeat protein